MGSGLVCVMASLGVLNFGLTAVVFLIGSDQLGMMGSLLPFHSLGLVLSAWIIWNFTRPEVKAAFGGKKETAQ